MQAVAHDFQPADLVGGHVALDLANTVTARDTTPRDWLDGYARLLEWATLAGVIAPAAAARLRSAADRAPREAAAALGRARKLREALHDTCVALLGGRSPATAALRELESAWKRAAARTQLQADDGTLQPRPDAQSSGLDLPLDLVVLAAVALLGEIDRDRTRVCRGHDCGWLFIDTSKGGRRVWCDMATCGNAAKSARFARAGRRRRARVAGKT
jgi:predicted RNA-binding Zn ribbon-like protein